MMYNVAMHRTQIILEDWQYQALKSLSEKNGASLAAELRSILTHHLRARRKSARARLRAIEGLGEDAKSSGRDHDRFLYGNKGPRS